MYKSLLLIVYPKAKEIIATKNKGIIEEIDNSKCEVIDVYLDNGNIWEAFLKKNNEIYLNTGLSVTVKI